jgi:hypothetical protein
MKPRLFPLAFAAERFAAPNGRSHVMTSALRRSVAGAIACLALFAANAAGAAGPPLTDPSGDSGTAADITAVSVSNDAKRQITFQVSFAGGLASADSVAIFLDTDQNAATGNTVVDGAEYLFTESESGNSFGLAHWDGANWQVSPATTASVTGGSGSNTLTFSINASDLGGISGFNFWVGSIDGNGGAGHEDQAPDSGTWNYQLSSGLVQLHVAAFETFSAPRAGHLFKTALIAQTDTGEYVGLDATLACVASVGGRTLTGFPIQLTVKVGGVQIPVQGCDWALPKWTRGKTLRGTITLTLQGAKVSHRFSVRVH